MPMRQLISTLVVVLVINLTPANSPIVEAQSAKEVLKTGKIKAKVAELGTGRNVQVIVELKDGGVLKGHLASAATDNFIIEDSKGGQLTVAYTEVKDVSRKRPTALVLAITIPTIAAIAVGELYGITAALKKCSACID